MQKSSISNCNRLKSFQIDKQMRYNEVNELQLGGKTKGKGFLTGFKEFYIFFISFAYFI